MRRVSVTVIGKPRRMHHSRPGDTRSFTWSTFSAVIRSPGATSACASVVSATIPAASAPRRPGVDRDLRSRLRRPWRPVRRSRPETRTASRCGSRRESAAWPSPCSPPRRRGPQPDGERNPVPSGKAAGPRVDAMSGHAWALGTTRSSIVKSPASLIAESTRGSALASAGGLACFRQHVCMPAGPKRLRVARRACFVALLLLTRPAAAESDGMLAFAPDADTYLPAPARGRAFGTAPRLWASGAPLRQSFLRFTVTGIGSRVVGQAVLRLTVGSERHAASRAGGSVHLVTDNGWTEPATTYNTRPRVDGPVLAQQGAVTMRQAVDFDVTAAVVGDGTYSFAVESSARDAVWYRSRQARSGRPELRVVLAPEPKPEVLGVEDLSF